MPTSPASRHPALAWIALASVLVGFGALAVRVALALDRPPGVLEQKLVGAERYLYYRIAPDTGPVFELTGDESTIRLVTHVAVPRAAEGAYDPAGEVEYGLRFELDRGGGATWRRDVYTRSRQSKARRDAGGIWLDENTFSLDGLELTDDRLVAVTLPPDVGSGATLRVTLLGDSAKPAGLPASSAQGFVRAYTPILRDDADQRARDLLGADRSKLAERISYLPWDRLSSPQDLASVRYAERRLSAEGKEGVDYETRTLYTTDFRLRYQTAIERGLLVSPDRDVAVNVVGPARIAVTATRPAAFQATPGTLEVRLIGDTAVLHPPQWVAPPVLTIALPSRGGSATHELEIPAGAHSLTASAIGGAANVELIAAPNRAVALGGGVGVPLVPDEQNLPVFVSQPGGPPIAIAVPETADLVGRVFRIDVRVVATTPALDAAPRTVKRWASIPSGALPPALAAEPQGFPPVASFRSSTSTTSTVAELGLAPRARADAAPAIANLTVEAIDAGGRVIATSQTKIESPVSRFESATFAGNLVGSVGEPIGVRYVVPVGGHEVRLRSDRSALVQISTPAVLSPAPDRPDVPYDVPLVAMVWRYARYLERGWVAVRPHNQDALALDRTATLGVQARLEPRAVPPRPELNGTALAPEGRRERQTVIERIGPEDVPAFVARWAEGHYTRVVPGRVVALDLGRLPSRPSIEYSGPDAIVGARYVIVIDGVRQQPAVFASAHGRVRLPAGLIGTHALAIETGAPARLLVDRPPAGTAAELYAVRSVYQFSGRFRIAVTKRGPPAQNVNIVVYGRAATADPSTSISIVIDSGNPTRIAGVALANWTIADRSVALPIADRPATLAIPGGLGAMYPRSLVISLGDDLPAGVHTVDVATSTRAAGAPGWVRSFTLDSPPVAPRATQWRDDTSEAQ